jgi:signal transduction histidine kinase
MRARLAGANTLVILSVVLAFGLASLPLRLIVARGALDGELARTGDVLVQSPLQAAANADSLATPVMLIQADTLDGTIRVRSANMGDVYLPVSPDDLARARGGQTWFGVVSIDGHTLRTYHAAFSAPAAGVVQVASPIDEEPPHGASLLALLLGMFVGVGAASAVAWYLARLAMVPIEQLAATVDSISSTADLSRRVPILPVAEPRHDPIQRLGLAFNAMLERLQAATQQLETTLEAQRHFVADASHHLRTPLTSLRGNVHFLSRLCAEDCPEAAVDQHQDVLTELDGEAERMTRLINNLLWLARADAQQHFDLQPLELEPIMQAAYRTARALSETVTVQIAEVEPGIKVCADSERLLQLLLILLDNAVRYSPPEGLVTLRAARQVHDQRPGVAVEVVDGGPGIPPGERELIFGRFYRARPTATVEGSGLGLAVARWIALEHAGQIDIRENLPAGSIFEVWLPTVGESEYS